MERNMDFGGKDRRLAERFEVRTPLRLRTRRTGAEEQRAESSNVSRRGVFFATAFPLSEGATVDLLMEMPEAVTGVRAAQWICMGHVVRVDPPSVASGTRGIGVEFDFYVVSHPATPRWEFGPGIRGPLRP